MNRNSYDYFSQVPRANIGRSTFQRDSGCKTTFNVGDLIPIYCSEVLPGDTWQMQTAKVVRLQTLLAPIMDNVYLDTYWFYVPNELTWEHWREFCGENTQSAWAPTTEYSIPVLKPGLDGTYAPKSIADYFGIPVGKAFTFKDANGNLDPGVNALPFRAYAMIVDSFFRDQNILDPVYIYKGDGATTHSYDPDDSYVNQLQIGGVPFRVAKYHDYFTSVLPAPQKGDPVQMPVNVSSNPFFGTSLPVLPLGVSNVDAWYAAGKKLPEGAGMTAWFGSIDSLNVRTKYDEGNIGIDEAVGTLPGITAFDDEASGYINMIPDNLVASTALTNLSFDINAFRLAYATQSYLEALARGGSRYTEMLSSIFGVTSPDARLHEPEYLGGNRVPVQIHQVTNTAQSATDFLGETGAMSVTSDNHYDFEKSFTEHGYVIGLCCVRYDHTYSQGLEKMWRRRSFLDFYNPYFANIGEQPVYNYELYCMDADEVDTYEMENNGVFGYQQAWSDYRYKPNRVTGDMRPNVTGSLATWNLADDYDEPPVLSPEWLQEDPNNVDRALAVKHTTADSILADFYFNCRVTRPMPMFSIPGLGMHE